MMAAGPTPGPWRTSRGSKGKANFGGWQTKVTATDSVGLVTVAQVFSGNGPNDTAEQCDANARLIAAAPDLLEALKRLDALVESLWDSVPWGQTFRLPIAELNEVPIQAKRAIAKATEEPKSTQVEQKKRASAGRSR